MKATEF